MSNISVIGMDLSKQVFHVVGLNTRHKVVIKKMLKRKQLITVSDDDRWVERLASRRHHTGSVSEESSDGWYRPDRPAAGYARVFYVPVAPLCFGMT